MLVRENKSAKDPLVPLDKDARVPTPDLHKRPPKKKKRVPKILLSFLTNMLLSLLISKNAPLRTIS